MILSCRNQFAVFLRCRTVVMRSRDSIGPAGKHNRAHDGDQDQHRRDFKREQKIVEKKPRNTLGIAP